MIYQWKPEGEGWNFGDALGPFLFFDDLLEIFQDDSNYLICLIGSVINNRVIEYADFLGRRPLFISCGWDGTPLSPSLLRGAVFLGSRGPITQAELSRLGVEVSVTGDVGSTVAEVFPTRIDPLRQVLVVPHIADPDITPDIKGIGVDCIVSVRCNNNKDVERIIDRISGAAFVLAGSLHSAVVAHAYGVPFAPYRSPTSGFVDHPIKWRDWLESIGVHETGTVSSINEGYVWYQGVSSGLKSDVLLRSTYRALCDKAVESLAAFKADKDFQQNSGL